MTGSAFEGFRKVIEKEFSKIYVFNLRGDATSQGEMRRKEGDGVFGDGSRTAIAITLLVKRKGFSGKAEIQYVQTDDYMKRQEKFDMLNKSVSFGRMSDRWNLESIEPRLNGDWLVERNEIFDTLIPLAGDTSKKFEKHCEDTVFVGSSIGCNTARFAWCYNYSKDAVQRNMQRMSDEYNRQVITGVKEIDKQKISWTDGLNTSFVKRKKLIWDKSSVCIACYRPFTHMWLSSDPQFIERTYQMPRLFPYNKSNLLICVNGLGGKKEFSCMMTGEITDIQLMANGQCFPLYWYNVKDTMSDSKQSKLMEFEHFEPIRHDGISQFIRDEAQNKYGVDVSSGDLFFYVYGYLHSPEYRSMFSDNLKLSLPKIGLVNSYDDFMAFSEAGRKLSDLHTKYEDVEPYYGVRINGDAPIEDILGKTNIHHVTKMKLVPDKHRLIYNEYITIDDIPNEAFEYVVNGRSALGWIVDRYQITTDKESGIVNDPNEYAGSTYILKLVLSVINVSVKTMEIVKNLPSIGLDKDMGES